MFDPQIIQGVRILAARCDGASSNDGRGFSKFDSAIGRSFADRADDQWSVRMAQIAYRVLSKYRAQLADAGIDFGAIQSPGVPEEKAGAGVITFHPQHATASLNIKAPGFDSLRAAIKAIPGARWNNAAQEWTVPLRVYERELLGVVAARFGVEVVEGVEAAKAEKSPPLILPNWGEKKPYEYQQEGIRYGIEKKRFIMGDEPGLGKTIQALGIARLLNAFPLLILCPSTAKYVWANEVRDCLLGNTVQVIPNGGPESIDMIRRVARIGRPDVTIITYDLASDFSKPAVNSGKGKKRGEKRLIPKGILAELMAVKWGGVVCDESHYLKSKYAQRTQAAWHLMNAADVRILVTGTVVLNSPSELLSQLELIGRLDDFGGWHRFASRYCGMKKGRYGRDISGATNLVELNRRLRETCYIRREKAEVLTELPPKRRAIVPVYIDNMREYKAAEADVIAWLQAQIESVESALIESGEQVSGSRAELAAQKQAMIRRIIPAKELIRFGVLKRLAAKGKVKAAAEWIHNFLESGQKLIVFAVSRDIQAALAAAFPGQPHIFAADDAEARAEAVARFQGQNDARVILCSLGAAGVSWTGTAASDLLFVEQGWTPGEHDQAEDRAHRIGQKESVTAWYMIGKNTVDTRVARLIERKRAITVAVQDGREQAGGDEQAMYQLAADFLQSPENSPE